LNVGLHAARLAQAVLDATIHQIMAISGHLTMKEVERYTKMADRAHKAREAMQGRTEQAGNCHTTDCV
jgi:hypothetical protein